MSLLSLLGGAGLVGSSGLLGGSGLTVVLLPGLSIFLMLFVVLFFLMNKGFQRDSRVKLLLRMLS